MKLEELKPPKGTYVGLKVLGELNQQLYNHCRQAKIPVSKKMFDKGLHTTVIYSRNHCPNIQPLNTLVHRCYFSDYAIFGTDGERVLVIKLNAPSVVARHLQIMSSTNATYDFPVYEPHITLSYKFTGASIAEIPPIGFPILLGDEYVEDLDLNWNE